jgi:diguanylate cyclase (GGDEF)-like protein/PAS domain S-box-containing protein
MSSLDNFQSLHYYREIMNQARDIILITHTDGTIIDANAAAIKCYGYSLPEFKTLTLETLQAPASWQKTGAKSLIETSHCRKDGSIFPAEVSAYRLNIASGHVIINIIRDITEYSQIRESLYRELESIKHAQKELLAKNMTLEKLASTDKLTGLWNRRYLENAALCETQRASRYNLTLSLILFDIDYFKHYNDSFGHQIGDNLLIMVSNLIAQELRTNDIFARWGGDEFIILLPNTDALAAWQTAEKIRSITETYKAPPVDSVTLSMGVAEYITNETVSEWINRADDALYLAKRDGRNAVKTAV